MSGVRVLGGCIVHVGCLLLMGVWGAYAYVRCGGECVL